MQGKGEGKRSAAVQFKTMDGPLLTQSCQLQPIQPTGIPSRLHISWLKWRRTFPHQVKATDFPVFHSSNTEQERLTNKGQRATLAARPRCVFTQGHRKNFEISAVLSAAPLPDTPVISCVPDQALLLCR